MLISTFAEASAEKLLSPTLTITVPVASDGNSTLIVTVSSTLASLGTIGVKV